MSEDSRWDRQDDYLRGGGGSVQGSIIPVMVVVGMLMTVLAWFISKDPFQTGAFGLLFLGSLGLWCWLNVDEVEQWHRLDVVHEYGSSGSFIRFIGNILLAVIVVGLVAIAGYWVVEKSFLADLLTQTGSPG